MLGAKARVQGRIWNVPGKKMRSGCLGVRSKESRGVRWNERPSSCSHVGLSKELEISLKYNGHQAEGVGIGC